MGEGRTEPARKAVRACRMQGRQETAVCELLLCVSGMRRRRRRRGERWMHSDRGGGWPDGGGGGGELEEQQSKSKSNYRRFCR